MHPYGFYGDVGYTPQNRYKPYHRGTTGLGLIAPASAEPILSGGYRGAPGRLVRLQPRSRDVDRAMMSGLGVTLAGFGDLSDRELCKALTTAGGTLVSAIGGAAIGARPTQRAGETNTAFNARVSEWETQTRITSTSGTGITAASTLCNLIDDADPATDTSAMSELDRMRAEQALRDMYAAQQRGMWTKVAIGVGAVAVVGVAIYLLK